MQFNNVEVINFKEKVWVSEDLQLWLIDWHHETLRHGGSTWTINSISQSFDFPRLRSKFEDLIQSCDTGQRHKKSNKKAYRKPPLVSVLCDKMPWNVDTLIQSEHGQ
jgi:hypothetical protein